MIREIELAKYSQDRGAILQVLKQGYEMEMVSLGTLSHTLNMVGQSMTRGELQFSLSLLADSGYVRIWRAKDMAGWRTDRPSEVRPDVIMFAKLTPVGLGLVNGYVAADPQVSFA